MNIFARLVVAALLLTACTSASPTPAPGSVDGRIFLSTAVTDGDEPFALVDGTRIRISFTDGQIGLSAGCNTMGGSYQIVDGVLLASALSMTEMGCDPARHAQDDWLSEFVGAQPTITLNGNDLMLRAGDRVITLLDREIAEPDLPLVGTTWTVASIISGGAVTGFANPPVATLVFTDDGQVQVQTGCNSGSGTVEVTGDTIRFREVGVTERACGGSEGQMEAAMLAVLGADAVTFQIDASTLTLMVGANGLQLLGS